MRVLILTLIAVLLLVAPSAIAQRDSLSSLTMEEYLGMVRAYHPIAKSAELLTENAESNLRRARGAFDPKVEAAFSEKFYKETSYYSIAHSALKVPTRTPLALKLGYDLNSGTYLDPSINTPDDGLLAAGLSMPLLQGLLTDERRTAFRMAQAFSDFSEAERKAQYNRLMFEAYGAYWNWWSSVEKTTIADDMLNIASVRFDAIKERAFAGDRPFIDTVEAFLQVQLREQQYLDALMNEVKSRFFLSSFLWYEDENASVPTGLIVSENAVPTRPSGVAPPEVLAIQKQNILSEIDNSHPEIVAYDAKIDQLEAELRWKQEKLKPKLDIEYNFLNTGMVNAEDVAFSTRNYKWGLNFSFPIFIREARGDVQMSKIKIVENNYMRDLKAIELSSKASAAFENYNAIRSQVNIAERNVNNYATLLEAERIRFFNGESSLFIVNQREMALADARNKLVDLQAKQEMAGYEILFLLGKLN